MKTLTATLVTLALAALPLTASPAGSDKLLQSLKGSVTYGPQRTPTTRLPHLAQVALGDRDFTATGANSEASIVLPDSSKVLVGSNSNVQLVSFDQASIASAKFVVVGKVRFTVEHPAGARANYTFTTGTGQIAVRGTVGDIFAGPNGLQVNVYEVSNPALPVQVTLANGQVFTLAAGQSLVATAVAGTVTASVTSVSQSLFSPFSEFGAPANASALGIGAAGAAGTASAATAAAAVAGAAAVTTAVSNSNKPIQPPAPSPTPTSTTAPINVQSVPRGPVGPAAVTPPPAAPAPHPPEPGAPGGHPFPGGMPHPPHPGGRPSPRP